MGQIIEFENNSQKKLEIWLEPSAEDIQLLQDETMFIELIETNHKFNDKLTIVLENDRLIIYECRQFDMKIFINQELKYYTTPDMPRI